MIECGAQHESGHTSATPYTTLIRACGKALEVDKAFRVLHCMLDVGVRPNVVTFNCLIDACGKASQVCVTQPSFHTHRTLPITRLTRLSTHPRNSLPSVSHSPHSPPVYLSVASPTFVSAQPCLWMRLQLDKALKAFKLMQQCHSVPDIVTYSCIVDSFCKAGLVDTALELFKQMRMQA